MTHPGSSTPPAGWYPDPADPRRSRWWDGTAWTTHTSEPGVAPAGPASGVGAPGTAPPFQTGMPTQGVQPVQPGPAFQGQRLPAGPAPRPKIDSRTPVDNPYIWGVVLLPLLSVIFLLAWNPEFRVITVGPQNMRMLDPASIFTPWYIAIVASSFVLYGVSVLLAYLDWNKLSQDGVVRPFHWAWCFLSPAVYVVGRSIIVHGVAAGRGLGPVWALIGTYVVATVVGVIKSSAMMTSLMSSIPG